MALSVQSPSVPMVCVCCPPPLQATWASWMFPPGSTLCWHAPTWPQCWHFLQNRTRDRWPLCPLITLSASGTWLPYSRWGMAKGKQGATGNWVLPAQSLELSVKITWGTLVPCSLLTPTHPSWWPFPSSCMTSHPLRTRLVPLLSTPQCQTSSVASAVGLYVPLAWRTLESWWNTRECFRGTRATDTTSEYGSEELCGIPCGEDPLQESQCHRKPHLGSRGQGQ